MDFSIVQHLQISNHFYPFVVNQRSVLPRQSLRRRISPRWSMFRISRTRDHPCLSPRWWGSLFFFWLWYIKVCKRVLESYWWFDLFSDWAYFVTMRKRHGVGNMRSPECQFELSSANPSIVLIVNSIWHAAQSAVLKIAPLERVKSLNSIVEEALLVLCKILSEWRAPRWESADRAPQGCLEGSCNNTLQYTLAPSLHRTRLRPITARLDRKSVV